MFICFVLFLAEALSTTVVLEISILFRYVHDWRDLGTDATSALSEQNFSSHFSFSALAQTYGRLAICQEPASSPGIVVVGTLGGTAYRDVGWWGGSIEGSLLRSETLTSCVTKDSY